MAEARVELATPPYLVAACFLCGRWLRESNPRFLILGQIKSPHEKSHAGVYSIFYSMYMFRFESHCHIRQLYISGTRAHRSPLKWFRLYTSPDISRCLRAHPVLLHSCCTVCCDIIATIPTRSFTSRLSSGYVLVAGIMRCAVSEYPASLVV